jgi:hypothetical protein
MSGDPKPKVTLEDLLRLKREERPAPEFWSRFDRELRAKQLAALVEKRPWWQGIPAWALNWRRFHLPLGATAALALTLVSLRDSGSHPVAAGPTEVQTSPTVVTERASRDLAPAVEGAVIAAPVLSPTVASSVSAARGVAMEESTESESLVAEAALQTLEPESSPPVAAGLAEAVSARFAGGKVLAALDNEPNLGRGLTSVREAKNPVVRGASVEPLAQMSSPTEVRRARFRTALATPVAKETLAQANDRLARNLSDERMNDAVRRFDAKADRLSLKF